MSTNSTTRAGKKNRSLSKPLFLSEKRDSNPRPQPWQGCALPAELFSHTVRMKGLEPPRLSAPDPKSGVATNYTTSALIMMKTYFFKRTCFVLSFSVVQRYDKFFYLQTFQEKKLKFLHFFFRVAFITIDFLTFTALINMIWNYKER